MSNMYTSYPFSSKIECRPLREPKLGFFGVRDRNYIGPMVHPMRDHTLKRVLEVTLSEPSKWNLRVSFGRFSPAPPWAAPFMRGGPKYPKSLSPGPRKIWLRFERDIST